MIVKKAFALDLAALFTPEADTAEGKLPAKSRR